MESDLDGSGQGGKLSPSMVELIVQQILEAEMDETVGRKKVSAHPIGEDTGVDIPPRLNLRAPPGRGRKAPGEYAGPAGETGGHAPAREINRRCELLRFNSHAVKAAIDKRQPD